MALQSIHDLFRTRLTVYRHEFKTFGRAAPLGPGEAFLPATEFSIAKLFSDDPALAARFRGFVSAGFEGLFLTCCGQWATYGWFSTPCSAQPHHLPRWTRNLDACWIFYCHTKQPFRGRGLFAKLLRQMVETVRGRKLASNVYVDTLVSNSPSRRVILASGFIPCGMITTYQLRLPRFGNLFLIGSWNRAQCHPPLQPGAAGRAAAAVINPAH